MPLVEPVLRTPLERAMIFARTINSRLRTHKQDIINDHVWVHTTSTKVVQPQISMEMSALPD